MGTRTEGERRWSRTATDRAWYGEGPPSAPVASVDTGDTVGFGGDPVGSGDDAVGSGDDALGSGDAVGAAVAVGAGVLGTGYTVGAG
jgi:hypothetical protein